MNLSLQVEERTFLKRLDLNFIFVIFALNLVGLINLYSATHGVHAQGLNRLFLSQFVWLGVGWSLFFLFTFTDYKFLSRLGYVLYGLNVAAIIVVMFIGKTYYGAQRWIDLGFFHFQPSETMKLMIVVILAKWLARRPNSEPLGIKDLIIPGLFTAIPFIFVVKQPDLGTALLIAAIAGTMVLFVGIRKKVLISLFVIVTISMPIIWSFGLKDYQKNRILTFVDPGRDRQGAGYNSLQSKIAVGSGKFWGKGFRKGTQSQLEFLPERHTDFIYSVLSEEHGFVGSTTVIALFSILFILGIRIAGHARDKFAALMVVGLLSLVFWHFFINVGMVIGLLPIVGVPLPLLSYGGTNMLTTMIGMGLISNVSYRKFLF